MILEMHSMSADEIRLEIPSKIIVEILKTQKIILN